MMKKIKLGLLALLIGGVAFGAANRVWESQEWLSGHITTPSNPSAGKTKMYFKSDNKLYKLTSGGVETEVGAGSGDLVGPASSTDEAVCRFDGTTGKLAQNSVVGISDTGAVTGVTSLSLSGAISGGTTFSGTGATLSGLTASRALTTDGSKNLASSAVTSTELGYVSGVTSAIQTQIDGKQATDTDLTAVAGLSTTGLIARTGAGTASTRTVTGTANQITVTDGDGVSGNPTLSIPSDPVFSGTSIQVGTSSGPTIVSGTSNPTSSATAGNPGSLYLNTSTAKVYKKNDSGTTTNWSELAASSGVAYGAKIAAPSGGSCTVTEVNGANWINGNGTSSGTGLCALTFIGAFFGSAPSCTCSAFASGGFRMCTFDSAPTTSGVTISTGTASGGGSANNSDAWIICTGT